MGIDAVLVEQIDRLDPQPLERAFAGALDIGGGGIDPGHAVVVIAETELGRDHHRIALAANGTTDQFLIDQGAIDFGGVEQGHAQLNRAVDGRDALRLVCLTVHIPADTRHRHAAETECGNLEFGA